MEKGFQRKDYHSNAKNTQGGDKPFNIGFKKVADNPREPLKYWECGEPHLWRNCPCLKPTTRTSIHNIQEASTIGYIGRSMHKINAALDGR
jgi:hypothetical protein